MDASLAPHIASPAALFSCFHLFRRKFRCQSALNVACEFRGHAPLAQRHTKPHTRPRPGTMAGPPAGRRPERPSHRSGPRSGEPLATCRRVASRAVPPRGAAWTRGRTGRRRGGRGGHRGTDREHAGPPRRWPPDRWRRAAAERRPAACVLPSTPAFRFEQRPRIRRAPVPGGLVPHPRGGEYAVGNRGLTFGKCFPPGFPGFSEFPKTSSPGRGHDTKS
ncbi:hypothetical protein SAMN05421505_15310 [Sinosporangium album]|uniref:Uncharacterized protein n=1 Tax=Sinosporangium album TaxID=504805 RepID=A0A1G8KQQ5_9ACTN|nr:hypothetical protein SAMN05421505_15310 [Sinosporangium album]